MGSSAEIGSELLTQSLDSALPTLSSPSYPTPSPCTENYPPFPTSLFTLGLYQGHLDLPWGVRVQRPGRLPTSIPAATENTAVSRIQRAKKPPPKQAHIVSFKIELLWEPGLPWASVFFILIAAIEFPGPF